MRKSLATLAGLAIAGAALISCGESDSDLILSNSGKVNVLLTDAPFPFSEVKSVNVDIVRIDGKLADADEAEIEDDDEMSGWRTLVSPDENFELLTLTGGNTASLGVATVPVGSYKAFRLVLDTDNSSVTLNDNSEVDVKWPSAGKSGVKILLDEPFVVASGTTDLLLDFDVGRSFVMRGNSIRNNGLLFKPVIRAAVVQSTGTLSGTVRGDTPTGALIPGATVEVLKAGTVITDTDIANVVATGVTDANGAFTIAFIPAGTYVVRATPTVASGYKPALLVGGAVITAGSTLGSQVIIVTK
jgi:hypothetical protein